MQYYKPSFIKKSLLVLLVFSFLYVKAQTEVFKSNLYFSDSNLSNFISSISIDSTQIYLNSNDYYLHVFDKKSGTLNWSYYLAKKTNTAPIVYKNSIIVGKHISEYDNKCVQLNSKTGDTIQTLKIDEIFNQPIFKDNIMFSTAITNETGGCILAYDLNKNEILWKQFVAHGVSTQPYFLKNKIVANAEENNWFDIDYNGKKDTICKNKASIFVENINCVKNFKLLTHDNKEISGDYLSDNLGENEILISKFHDNKTFILGTETLTILGNNKKVLQKLNINNNGVPLENNYNVYKEILKIENNSIWFLINNKIVNYDFLNKKINVDYDLSQWNPHKIILENNLLYLISKKDGQLYILNIN